MSYGEAYTIVNSHGGDGQSARERAQRLANLPRRHLEALAAALLVPTRTANFGRRFARSMPAIALECVGTVDMVGPAE